MQKIVPHLWFDNNVVEAVNFYLDTFPNSQLVSHDHINDTPSGDVDIMTYDLMGYRFMAINGGPFSHINPTISFKISSASEQELTDLWARLVDGGKVLMPFEQTEYTAKFGWLEDKFGVSWQFVLEADAEMMSINLVIMYVGSQPRAEEAINFYSQVLPDSSVVKVDRYPSTAEMGGNVMYAEFKLCNQKFNALDGGAEHQFNLNEAVSLIVYCEDQAEIDKYWEALSADPKSEQCGWLKDKFGVSWQIVPTEMGEMMSSDDQQAVDRVTQAFLPMKKLDIQVLRDAYNKKG